MGRWLIVSVFRFLGSEPNLTAQFVLKIHKEFQIWGKNISQLQSLGQLLELINIYSALEASPMCIVRAHKCVQGTNRQIPAVSSIPRQFKPRTVIFQKTMFRFPSVFPSKLPVVQNLRPFSRRLGGE